MTSRSTRLVMRVWLAVVMVLPGAGQAQLYLRTVANTVGETQICVTWNRRDFTYHVDTAGSSQTPGDTEYTAIDSAFATWQALSKTCSDFTFTRGDRVTKPVVGHNSSDANVITFREVHCSSIVPANDPCLADEGTCGNKYTCWDHSEGTIALTTVTYSTKTGIAVDADIELNAADFLLTSVSSPPCDDGREMATCVAYDIQNTMTHEIGHVVGFAHVLSDPNSLMYPTAPLGETTKRSIDNGTATGFCTTYPKGQPPVPCDEQLLLQRHIIANTTCGSADPASLMPSLVVALLLVTMWRQKSNRG